MSYFKNNYGDQTKLLSTGYRKVSTTVKKETAKKCFYCGKLTRDLNIQWDDNDGIRCLLCRACHNPYIES